jgi:uncharacterized protein YozE (UPF0346 family)
MEKRMKFTSWLMEQWGRDDPIGDLANDARDDQSFPAEVASLDALDNYLFVRGAGRDARDAAAAAWREFNRISN